MVDWHPQYNRTPSSSKEDTRENALLTPKTALELAAASVAEAVKQTAYERPSSSPQPLWLRP